MSPWLLFKRRVFRKLTSIVLHLIARVDSNGLEKIGKLQGTVIIVCNHLGRLDAFLTLGLVQRDDLILVIAEKYREIGFVRWLAKRLDLLFLERFENDIGTLKEVIRRLERGGALVISPEGTRSPTESLLEGKQGAAFLAAKTKATIIPVGVTGTEDRVVAAGYGKLRRPHIHIEVGEPFSIPPLPRQDRNEFLAEQTKNIMLRIAALLPAKYRGVYSN